MKLENNNGRKAKDENFANQWKLCNIHLTNQWVEEVTRREAQECLETGDSGSVASPDLSC